MQAIFFDVNGKKLESLLNATTENVNGYFINNNDAYKCALVDISEHINNEVLLGVTSIIVGSTQSVSSIEISEGQFDFDYYSNTSDIFPDDLTQKININLIHIYNNGSVDTVPFPIPYSKQIETTSMSFVADFELSDITIIDRP